MKSDSSDVDGGASRRLVATGQVSDVAACKRCAAAVIPPQKVYCSKACKVRFRNARTRRDPSVCVQCGRNFMARRQSLREGNGTLCSHGCLTKHAKATGMLAGSNSPRWIDGRSLRVSRRYPEKTEARRAVKTALRAGRLVKQPCERCGSTTRTHAHHDDYSRPLDVRWLCPAHHADVHFEMRGLDSERRPAKVKAPRPTPPAWVERFRAQRLEQRGTDGDPARSILGPRRPTGARP